MQLGSLTIEAFGHTWHWEGWQAVAVAVAITSPLYLAAYLILVG